MGPRRVACSLVAAVAAVIAVTPSSADPRPASPPSPPSPPAGATAPAPELWSVGYVTWIRTRPRIKDGEFLGYVRAGSRVPVRSGDVVQGPGCPGGFVPVAPRGWVCRDRTVTTTPRPAFAAAADLTRGGPGPFPYRYAMSNGAPMYNRIPTPAEQARFERWLGKPGTHQPLPLTLRSHEELAVAQTIAPDGATPTFLQSGGSPREAPYDLVEQTIPLGSMLAYTRAFEAEGRTWLMSTDHTIVPADRVRPFRPSSFEGVDLRAGEAKLPIAWMRTKPRAQWRRDGDGFVATGASWSARSWAELTGASSEHEGHRLLETRARAADGAPLWIRAADATVVERAEKLAAGVKPGQKWVFIRLTQGTLVAYEGLEPVFATLVSPGSGGVPVKGQDHVKHSTTPTGTYYVTFKDKAATMSPETGKNRSFWIADVPHTMYFHPPFALHAAYWHERFGDYTSAGCVNLSPSDAATVFAWSDPPVPAGWQGVAGAGASDNGATTAIVIRR